MRKLTRSSNLIVNEASLKFVVFNRKEMNFDIQKLLVASYLEAEKSIDQSTQVGALLVNKQGVILSSGFNNFPNGVHDIGRRHQRPDKYLYTEHAERNAIFNAARMGIATQGLTMVCAWAACAECARAIINSGISSVIRHHKKTLDLDMNERWGHSIDVGDEMFYESGVAIIEVDPIKGFSLRRNGILEDTANL